MDSHNPEDIKLVSKRINIDFWAPREKDDTPPYQYLAQVLQHCPKAGLLYLELWRKKNKNNALRIIKEHIREEFYTTTTKLKNDLLLLVKEMLISYEETPHTIVVELVSYGPQEEDCG